MAKSGEWLQAELERRGLTQRQLAIDAGVGSSTINDIISKGHVARVDILFRPADALAVPQLEITMQAGLVRTCEQVLAEIQPAGGDYLIAELLEEFRQVPDEWKPAAIDNIRMLVRLSRFPPARLVAEPAGPPPTAKTPTSQTMTTRRPLAAVGCELYCTNNYPGGVYTEML